MKKTKFKFKVGDVLEHKASGEKVVVIKCEDEKESLSGGTEMISYIQDARYICDEGISRPYRYLEKDNCEIIYKKL